ncbi:MAG TPA: hypothetical protein VF634_12660, partial [Pyrinomonadaceae bacterium]
MLRYRWMQALLFAVIAVLTASQVSSQFTGLKATVAGSFAASAQEEQDKDKHKDHKGEKHKS